jgi:hypothetical protein
MLMMLGQEKIATGQADPMSILQAACPRDVLRHWRAVRGKRLMPRWSDIDPSALRRHLPYLWSWRYDAVADTFTGRIAGEEITAIFGKSLRHMPMAEFFKDWDYPSIFARHKRVVSEPCIAIGQGLVFSHAGRQGYGERLILPLADDGIHGDGIIGATSYDFNRLREAHPLAQSILSTTDEDVRYFPLNAGIAGPDGTVS